MGEGARERVETGGRREIGRSVGGRGIWVTTHGQGSRVVLMMASIHGSEGAGTPLLERLREHLEANPAELGGGDGALAAGGES
jgi:predicted deacylase